MGGSFGPAHSPRATGLLTQQAPECFESECIRAAAFAGVIVASPFLPQQPSWNSTADFAARRRHAQRKRPRIGAHRAPLGDPEVWPAQCRKPAEGPLWTNTLKAKQLSPVHRSKFGTGWAPPIPGGICVHNEGNSHSARASNQPPWGRNPPRIVPGLPSGVASGSPNATVSRSVANFAIPHVAAAIFVITEEDIRRSGATNIPDVFRMVPGVEVAQLDANIWVISIRGFSDRFPDKVLVLIDGRTVYTPTSSGVYWDQQDVPLEDIERIEVIRGPGGTIWGANAVNGVINITTKKAKDTKGGLVSISGGSEEYAESFMQWGGRAGQAGDYRVFGKYSGTGSLPLADGTPGEGGQNHRSGGPPAIKRQNILASSSPSESGKVNDSPLPLSDFRHQNWPPV